MNDAGLYLKNMSFSLVKGQQAKFLPRRAMLGSVEVIGHKLDTVWVCDGSPMEHRTFMLLYLPAGSDMSKTVSPDWQAKAVVSDKVGGYVALLELPA